MNVSSVISFETFGSPIAKGRPRFTTTGRTYTDAKTRQAELDLLAAFRSVAGQRPPHNGPVIVELIATFTPAMSWPKWRYQLAQRGIWPHLARPDLDNLVKILDGLNGHAWIDDSQIVEFRARKQFGSVASTRVTLTLQPQPIQEKP